MSLMQYFRFNNFQFRFCKCQLKKVLIELSTTTTTITTNEMLNQNKEHRQQQQQQQEQQQHENKWKRFAIHAISSVFDICPTAMQACYKYGRLACRSYQIKLWPHGFLWVFKLSACFILKANRLHCATMYNVHTNICFMDYEPNLDDCTWPLRSSSYYCLPLKIYLFIAWVDGFAMRWAMRLIVV